MLLYDLGRAHQGLLHCTFEICLMHSSEQKRKIKSQLEILSIPFYIVKTRTTREERGVGRRNMIIGQMTNCTEIPKLPLDGRRTIVDIWIRLRHLTSHVPQEVSAQDIRIILRVESMIKDQNQDRCNTDMISQGQLTRLQL